MPKFAVALICSLAFVFEVMGEKRNGPFLRNTTIRNFELTFNAGYLADINPTYFGNDTWFTLKGPKEYSFQVNTLKTLPADALSVYHTFERNSRNEYVPSITMKSTLCEDYEKERKGYPIFKCARLYESGVTECPFKAGFYKLSKASCLPSDCPIMLPGRYWLINNTWVTTSNEVLLRRIAEVTIERKIKIG